MGYTSILHCETNTMAICNYLIISKIKRMTNLIKLLFFSTIILIAIHTLHYDKNNK